MTDLEAIVKEYPVETWGKFNNHLKIGGVKLTADGSPQGKTAYFTTPYLTGGPGGEKNWRGEPSMPQADLDKLVKQVYDWNVPLLVHTNGDAAIDMFLASYEKARAGDFSRPWNVTTIHTQFMRKDHIPKFVQYKIRPSFYTLHTFYFASAHKANRGEKQAAYLSPMRDAIDAGLRPTNHTDFYVAPLDQMFMMWSAVNRESREGGVLGPDQRVTPFEALKAQTIWAAEQYDEQDNRGTLTTGKIGDLVILDKNPLKVEPMSIKDIKVLETIKEGKTIYTR
jgi:predicted amidohydrolase YtcJ